MKAMKAQLRRDAAAQQLRQTAEPLPKRTRVSSPDAQPGPSTRVYPGSRVHHSKDAGLYYIHTPKGTETAPDHRETVKLGKSALKGRRFAVDKPVGIDAHGYKVFERISTDNLPQFNGFAAVARNFPFTFTPTSNPRRPIATPSDSDLPSLEPPDDSEDDYGLDDGDEGADFAMDSAFEPAPLIFGAAGLVVDEESLARMVMNAPSLYSHATPPPSSKVDKRSAHAKRRSKAAVRWGTKILPSAIRPFMDYQLASQSGRVDVPSHCNDSTWVCGCRYHEPLEVTCVGLNSKQSLCYPFLHLANFLSNRNDKRHH